MTAEKPEEAIARGLFERDVKSAGMNDTWQNASTDLAAPYWHDASTALAALKSAGFAVVPVKPTRRMSSAGGYVGGWRSSGDDGDDLYYEIGEYDAEQGWFVMLAAAEGEPS